MEEWGWKLGDSEAKKGHIGFTFQLTEKDNEEFNKVIANRKAESGKSELTQQELNEIRGDFLYCLLGDLIFFPDHIVTSVVNSMDEDELKTITDEDLMDKIKEESKRPELVDSMFSGGVLHELAVYRDTQLRKFEAERRKANKKWWEFWI